MSGNSKPYIVIFLTALVGILLIWVVCLNYIPLEKDRVPAFLTAAVSYLVLMAMFVQTYIYKKQSDTMQDGLARTDRIIAQNTELVGTMKAQVDLMEDSLAQADEAVEQSKQTLIYSQRAYVTAGVVEVVHNFEKSKFVLKIENFGRTPANNVVIFWNIALLQEAPECCRVHEGAIWDVGTMTSIGVIAPEEYPEFPVPFVAQDKSADWKYGTTQWYCWGMIEYTDIFRDGRRKSHFAFVHCANDGSKARQCEAGNEAY
ncbi:MAG: hypothetical protein IPI64_14600 [Chloracidobacterium sp.]|nr:hypothetical protein [Chloracidobacterium sp.]